MPAAAPFIGAVGTFLGIALQGTQYAAVGVIIALGTAVAASALSTAGSRDDRGDQSVSGHQKNTRSSRVPLPVCYGQFRIGVNKTFLHTTSQ